MSTTSEKLDRIIELLEERLPKRGCGDERTTVWSNPMNGERRETYRVCTLTAGHGGLHRDEDGNAQWPNVAVRDPEDDLDSLILSAHPEVRRHVEAVHESVRVLLKRQNDDQAKIERLTRERDEAEARCERLSVLAEKGERYEALRADVEKQRHDHVRGLWPDFKGILARDDERGRDD